MVAIEALSVRRGIRPGSRRTQPSVVPHDAQCTTLVRRARRQLRPPLHRSAATAQVRWPAFRRSRRNQQNRTVCLRADRCCVPRTSEASPKGIEAFWFRRAAVETTLHRLDVVEALGIDDPTIATERLDDAIEETTEFALQGNENPVFRPSNNHPVGWSPKCAEGGKEVFQNPAAREAATRFAGRGGSVPRYPVQPRRDRRS